MMIFHIFDAERKRGRKTEKNDAWLLCLLNNFIRQILPIHFNGGMECKNGNKKMLHNGKNKQLAGCLTIKVVERGWEREKGGIKMFETENIFHSTRETQLFPLPPTRMSKSCEEI